MIALQEYIRKYGLEKEWIEHSVLHFDMSTAKHQNKEKLVQEIEAHRKKEGVQPSFPYFIPE